MGAELTFPAGVPLAFLLLLARVSGAVVLVPLPGFQSAPGPARAVLALALTLALAGRWPAVAASAVTLASLAGWAAAEAAIGVALGLVVAVVLEAFSLAAQVLSLPAGYGYASAVDPATEADSGILPVLAQLLAGLLCFALGFDRAVLRLFGESLDRIPAGAYGFRPESGQAMVRMASGLFSVGVRLALPVVALLILVDVALGLVGRLHASLHLLSLAFPAKMLAALAMLVWLAALYPRILAEYAQAALAAGRQALGL